MRDLVLQRPLGWQLLAKGVGTRQRTMSRRGDVCCASFLLPQQREAEIWLRPVAREQGRGSFKRPKS